MSVIKIKLYSILREIAGSQEILINIDSDLTVEDFLSKLSKYNLDKILFEMKDSLRIIADGKVLSFKDKIPSNVKEIFILPSSSGGLVDIKVLTDEHIDLNELVKDIYNNKNVGAIALFIGVVRGINKGENVNKLVYEHSQELIESKLKEIAFNGIKEFGLDSVIIYHYVGQRMPGDLTMIVAVSGESRKNVFPGLEKIVDEVKHEAPIWKQEYRESGRYFILGEEQIKADELRKEKFQNKF
ncbi:MAG: molybdenum cofactor biosynthesis protein [Caldisphaera sp.]|jgi:molybdopterin synthase catalytic subunit|nr:molybdenum cofactor biosynthesis protein MoaE [Caldisphaera sp.]PMP59438.1 MAG: hypothetical protein C0201_04920 [Caldisphaera sp.]